MLNKKIVKIVLRECLGVKRHETFLIVCDPPLQSLANEFYKTAREYNKGGHVVLMTMPACKMHGEEPPSCVAEALKTADTAILLTSKSLSHTRARKIACKKYGTRIASLPGITRDICNRSIAVNYGLLKKRTSRVAKQLTYGKKVDIVTAKGTRLTMSIAGRKGFSDNGMYTHEGAFGNLPAGEACIAPIEGSTNGCLVIDGSEPIGGRVKKPVKIHIKNGYALNMPFPAIARLINKLSAQAMNIAELGIGLNPRAKVTGNVLEDEKARCTAHIALGNNQSFGGNVYCPCHLDFVFLNPMIYIDGKKVKST